MRYNVYLSMLLILLAFLGECYIPQVESLPNLIPSKNRIGESKNFKTDQIISKQQKNTTKAATVTVSGRVFQDGNGLRDGLVNGVPSNTVKNLPPAAPNQIYVLINHPCRYGCYQLQPVAADGTYSFQVEPNITYQVYVADFTGCIEDCVLSTAIAQSTGEHIGNGPGSDGKADSQITVEVGTTSVTDVNFGYDYLPIPTKLTANTQPNPLGNNQVVVPTLTGVDREDGYYDGVSGTNTIRLYLYDINHSFSTLYYNGIPVENGQIIANYDPNKLTIDPVDGNVVVQFAFSQIDAAGLEAVNRASVTMSFSDTVTQFDFGDAPAPYFTYLFVANSNGPRHVIVDGLRIGTLIDAEADGQLITSGYRLDYNATGDDITGQDDEDGVTTFPPLLALQQTYNLPVTVINTTGADATLSGWIDFNRNEVFSDNERAQVIVPAGATSVTLSWTDIPWTSRAYGDSYVRLRLASVASEVATTTGQANSGEVEDYKFYIQEAPLPVELTHFEGNWVDGTGNQLRWETAWEQTNDHFEIQSSTNAISFETIGRVAGQGTTTGTQQYEFVDTQPQANITYYRLKQVDINGSFRYSQIIAVKSGLVNQEAQLVAYPSPTADLLHVQVNKPHVITAITIYSMSGTQVFHQDGPALSTSVNSLPAGLYTVKVMTDTGQMLYQRFIKQ